MKILFFLVVNLNTFVLCRGNEISVQIRYDLIDSFTRKYRVQYILTGACTFGTKFSVGGSLFIKSIGTNAFNNGTKSIFGPINLDSYFFEDLSPKCNGLGLTACNFTTFNHIDDLGVSIEEFEFCFPKECNEYLFIFNPLVSRSQLYNNLPLSGLYQESYISFKNGVFNNSTKFDYHKSVSTYCTNQNGSIDLTCTDIDGDSLVYELENAQGYNAVNIGYVYGNYLNPTLDCGNYFDASKAIYKFRPTADQNPALSFRVKEFRNGILVGSTKQDILLAVRNNAYCHEVKLLSLNNSSCSIINTSQIKIDNFGCYKDTFPSNNMLFCENTPINIQIKLLNKQKGVTNYENMTGGYGIITDLDTNKRDSIRDFQYTYSNPKSGKYNIGLNLNYCPPDTAQFKINKNFEFHYRVLRSPRPSEDTFFYCTAGGAVDVFIDKLDSGVTFDWSHHSGFISSNLDSSKVKIALNHDTTYYIYYKYYGTSCPSCNMIDTIVIKYVPDFTYTTGIKNKNICINQSHQLLVNPSISGNPYTYHWMPVNTLYHPISGLKLDSTSSSTLNNPIAKPTNANNVYRVEIKSKTGCTLRDTFSLQVADSIPYIKAITNRNSFCICDTTQLSTMNQYPTCGKAEFPNYGSNSFISIGAGTKVYPNFSDTFYPSLFGATYAEVKHRILIKNSELASLGLTNKNIKEFFFQPFSSIGNIQEGKFYNIDISMACTNVDTITQSITTTPMAHFDSIELYPQWMSIPLNGNGYNITNGSHLIIEFSFKNDTNTIYGNKRFYVDSLPYHATAWVVGPGAKTSTAWTGISTIRPILRFYAGDLKQSTASNYSWTPSTSLNNANIQNPITNLCATQQFVVTAKQGLCEAKDSITIYVDTSYKMTARADTFICSDMKVRLNATVIGSPLPGNSLTYLWKSSPIDTSLVDSNIINPWVHPDTTTTYILKISGGACDKYDTVIITRGAPLSLSKSKKDATCSGANGRAIVKTNNGNPPFTYTWNPANINSDTIKNIISGKYKVTVQAADGCLGNDSITLNNIIQTPSITLTKQNVKCFGEANGNIKVKVNSSETGPFSFTWTPSKPNKDSIFGLIAGWYKLSLLDTPTNCTATDSIQITQPTKLNIDADSSDVLCFGNNTGTLTTTTSGGSPIYTYTWSNASIGNNANANNQIVGNYSVTVIDSKGCRDSNSTKINQPNKLVGSILQTTNVKCYGDSNGTATISTVGGTRALQYNWLNSTNQIDSSVNNLKFGIHEVIITDKNNCQDTVKNISIAQPDSMTIQIVSYPAKCFGQNNGSAKAIVTGGNGGYTYLWNEGTSIDSIQNKTAGNYSITVSDSKGCNKQSNASIYQSDSLSSANNTADSVRCFGEQNGKAIVHILGGQKPYTFNWNSTPIQIDSIAINLKAGNYLSTSTDMNGCKRIDNFNIYEPQKLKIDSIQIDAIDCKSIAGGKINIIAIGGNLGWQYSIGPSFQTSSIFANIDRGIYTATIQDHKGCQDTRVFAILQGKPIQINLQKTDATCTGIDNGMAWIQNIQGGLAPFIKTWSNGQATDSIQNLSGKKGYTLKIQDALNCIQIDSVFIETQSDIQVQSTIKPITCYNGSDGEIIITTSGGKEPYQYQWSTNETINPIKKLMANILYTLTIQDALGCVDTTSYVLKQVDSFYVDSIYYQAVTCPDAKNGWIKATVKGGTASNAKQYLFSLDSMRWQNDRLFLKLSGGNYTIYAIDANGCVAKRIANLYEPPRIQLSVFPTDTIVKIGYPVQLKTIITSKDTINQDRFKYQWNPTEGLDCYDCANPISKVNESTLYTVKLNYNEGCMYEGKAFIDVEDGIFIPNAFSPNQRDANENETFKVYGENIQSTHIQIFNRWSEKVYEESGANVSWNGYYHGDIAMQGVYSYHISITFIGGKKVEKNGSVTLLR